MSWSFDPGRKKTAGLSVTLLLCLTLPGAAGIFEQAGAATATAGAAYIRSVLAFRDNVDFQFRDRILSPLTVSDQANFDGLNYFEIDPAYAAPARFEAAADRSTFAMPTFDNRTLAFSHFGTITALVAGQEVRLKAFRRESDAVVRDFLLIPFRDSTNGELTYPGGRYIEINLPLPATVVLDFNRAMNPWCAYDPSYACPIPPAENHLDLPIPAGEKRFK